MKETVLLFDTATKAGDGSHIPLESVQKYLTTDTYKNHLKNGTALGGVTHRDREVAEEFSHLVANNDGMLLNYNTTHNLGKIYIEGTKVMGEINIFDETEFDEETTKKIKQLKGLLKNNVKPPISIAIHAAWNAQDVAVDIYDLKGLDFTTDPLYSGSGVI